MKSHQILSKIQRFSIFSTMFNIRLEDLSEKSDTKMETRELNLREIRWKCWRIAFFLWKNCRKMRRSLTQFCWYIEVWAVQNHVNLVDLVKSFLNLFFELYPYYNEYFISTSKTCLRHSRERAVQSLPIPTYQPHPPCVMSRSDLDRLDPSFDSSSEPEPPLVSPSPFDPLDFLPATSLEFLLPPSPNREAWMRALCQN